MLPPSTVRNARISRRATVWIVGACIFATCALVLLARTTNVVLSSSRPSLRSVAAESRALISPDAPVAAAAVQPVSCNGVQVPAFEDAPAHVAVALGELAPASISPPLVVILGDQSAWRNYLSPQFYLVLDMLSKRYGWQTFPYHAALGGTIKTWADLRAALEDHFGTLPSVLYSLEGYNLFDVLGTDLSPLRPAQLWMFANDLHSFGEAQTVSKSRALAASDLILTPYVHRIDDLVPAAANTARMLVSHAAAPHFALPMNSRPREQILLAGAVDTHYPYRQLVASMIEQGDTRFTQLKHPGWKSFNHSADAGVGPSFACTLHGYLAVITDGLTFNYPVAKVVEIPGTGALLLANVELQGPLEAMGFVAGIHYVQYARDTLDAVAAAVLDPANREAVNTIRRQGQALVISRHMVQHRAAQLHALAVAASGVASGGVALGRVPEKTLTAHALCGLLIVCAAVTGYLTAQRRAKQAHVSVP